jgi:FtsP/CotA-like multicopper oxidase with cupredoxin domain
MEMSRRSLLEGCALVAAAALVPAGAATARSLGVLRRGEPLPDLDDLGVIDTTAGGTARIAIVNAGHRFSLALPKTPTLAYRIPGGAQNYLGPVILARRGQDFTLQVENSLGRHPLAGAIDRGLIRDMIEDGVLPPDTNDAVRTRTALHLHGGNTAPGMDGGPLDTFLPGDTFRYTYANDQEAAGLWYHDHALSITRLNVYAGLASGYLLRDENDPGDGSRLPAPPYEVPLILQDKMFNPDGTLGYPPNPDLDRPWAPEFFGDVATVNGKTQPDLQVRRGMYRFRVYNGSNSRFYNLKLKTTDRDTLRFWQIGTDGGLLNAPVAMTKLLLGPGERADLLVDFAELPAGACVLLTNNARTPFPSGPRSVAGGGVPLPLLMTFSVTRRTGLPARLPKALRRRAIPRLETAKVAATRNLTLVEVQDADGIPQTALINNREFSSDEYLKAISRNGTVEQWNIINTTGDAHPIHLHYVQFQILNRQRFDVDDYTAAAYPTPVVPGTGPYPPPSPERFTLGRPHSPAANERGWKDTAVAMPGQITRLLVPFGTGAVAGRPFATGRSFTGTYAAHCHILEHEDNDMMQRYLVAD